MMWLCFNGFGPLFWRAYQPTQWISDGDDTLTSHIRVPKIASHSFHVKLEKLFSWSTLIFVWSETSRWEMNCWEGGTPLSLKELLVLIWSFYSLTLFPAIQPHRQIYFCFYHECLLTVQSVYKQKTRFKIKLNITRNVQNFTISVIFSTESW